MDETAKLDNTDSIEGKLKLLKQEIELATLENTQNYENFHSSVYESQEALPQYEALYEIPEAYTPTIDPRYYYHEATATWFDSYAGLYSYYDQVLQNYVQLEPLAAEDSFRENKFSEKKEKFIRLVVQTTETLISTPVIELQNNQIYIGRDKPTISKDYLRLPELAVSKFHAHIYHKELSDIKKSTKKKIRDHRYSRRKYYKSRRSPSPRKYRYDSETELEDYNRSRYTNKLDDDSLNDDLIITSRNSGKLKEFSDSYERNNNNHFTTKKSTALKSNDEHYNMPNEKHHNHKNLINRQDFIENYTHSEPYTKVTKNNYTTRNEPEKTTDIKKNTISTNVIDELHQEKFKNNKDLEDYKSSRFYDGEDKAKKNRELKSHYNDRNAGKSYDTYYDNYKDYTSNTDRSYKDKNYHSSLDKKYTTQNSKNFNKNKYEQKELGQISTDESYANYSSEDQYDSQDSKIDKEESGFYIIDCGSTLGTFLNDFRLSETKTSSKPSKLNHLDTLKIGTTVFQLHIHSDLPCSDCSLSKKKEAVCNLEVLSSEPVHYSKNEETIKIDSQSHKNHKAGLNELKKKFIWNNKRKEKNDINDDFSAKKNKSQRSVLSNEQKYTDRAAMRRDYEQTIKVNQAHIDSLNLVDEGSRSNKINEIIEEENVGYKLLSKMGWKTGSGLGNIENSISEPIRAVGNIGKSGIGTGATHFIENTNLDIKKLSYKQKNANVTYQRYKDSK
ncbi:hypothetical protein BB561_002807 [Smittium simulii]|uniref:G-patch domain-containing protein n=1 Tax=Smittium simulii TaxID=133385 RepID=A0A2T9YP46_9FUNG|nr:hypothetical protein BB561_002807 [Smittium simulii]